MTSLKLVAFSVAIYLAALVHAEAGWFCGKNPENFGTISACSSDDGVTGFDLPANYKSGDCFDDTAERSREVFCVDSDPANGNGMNIVDDSVCEAAEAKPALTISSTVCVYDWACSTDDETFHTCSDQDFYYVCTPENPEAAATQCYVGNFTRTVKCLNQSGVEGSGKCTAEQPETKGNICEIRSGCVYKWYCHPSDTAAPSTPPDQGCAAGDTTTSFPDTPTCYEDAPQSLSRNVKCFTYYSGLGYYEDNTSCDYDLKPVATVDLPACGQWTGVRGECVWDRNSCNSGTAEVTYTCSASQGCAGPQPEPTTEPCSTATEHCSYGFACAPTAATPIAERQACVPGDTVGFTLPAEGTCVDTVPTRDVICRAVIKDGDQVLKYEEAVQARCAIYPMPTPSTAYPEAVCRYSWMCSTDGGDTHTPCEDGEFACVNDDTSVYATKCYRGVQSREVGCYTQHLVLSDGKCFGEAPATTNDGCAVTDGCERKWACSPTGVAPEAMPAHACTAADTETGFPVEPTCWEAEATTLFRDVGCYYALDGVVVEDNTVGACSQPQPSTSKALSECAQWTKVTGTCVWDKESCNAGSADVTYTCNAPQGCVASEPAASTEACTTPSNHCTYLYVCAASASTDPAHYATCAYGDEVGFVLPTSGCVDEIAPRDVACLQIILDDTAVVATTFVNMTSCSATAAQAPNAVYDKTDVICEHEWQCSTDGTTFTTCHDSQFSCQASDPVVTASKCFTGQMTRTVRCLSEDDRVVANSKCSGTAPADTNGACTDKSGCEGVLVCLPTGSLAPDTMPTEACAKNDVTTGFPTTPGCWEGSIVTLSRDVRCYYAFNGEVTHDENGFYCSADRPTTTTTPPACAAWTLQVGECVWDGDMDTCTVGTRLNTYVCAQGQGKCVANMPPSSTTLCTLPTSQCGFRYVCAPADATTDDILDMTTAELSCADDKHFAFDATACYKDKEFTRTVVCFDAKNNVISTNAAEDCKDTQAPVDRVTRTDEQQCRADAYCAPGEDADESAWAKCLDEQGNSVASTFGPCTVDCSSATQTRAVRCVNELGSVLPNTSCDMDDVALEQYCAAPAQVSQVSVSSNTLTVGAEVEVQWCYYDGTIPSQEPVPTATATTATVTLSSASKKFFASVVATAVAKTGGVEFDVPVVAPAADAVLTVTVGALHSDSALLTVQSRCTADETYCGAHGTCSDATSTCTCTDGFSGVHCDVSPCDKCDGPFSHAASCADSGAQAGVCVCEPGYEGTVCEVKTDCKTTKQCQHGGFVGTGVDGVCAEVCTCSNNWTGATCNTCDNFCTGTANGKPDADCQACVCTRGYSGPACQCQQAYGALVFAGAPATTLQNTQWLAALQRAIRALTGLSEDAVEVSAAAASKGVVVVALAACPLQPKSASQAHAVLDTTALYAKWALVAADLKADTSVLRRGVLADLGAGVTAAATEDMYDPTCTGDACAKGKDPLENADNAATAAMLSAATVAAVVFLALIL